MRKIAVVTGTRAEYGLLYWIIKGIHEDPDLELQLIVTGMHLCPEFGMTVKEIENDGFPIVERVDMLLSSDTEKAISTSIGHGMIGFAKTYENLRPDILLVLGDRFEILSAVTAAVPFRIPVAHIHGGERTEGAMDELFRHAITKMSHIHFTSTEIYKERVVQMGEQPENVFCYGAPGLDNVQKLNLMSKEDISRKLELPLDKKIGVVTYHPVTLEKDTAKTHITELLEALKSCVDIYWVFTLPNADTGGRIIISKVKEFVKKNIEKGEVFISLGQLNYLSLLAHADLMVGNSSSGLIEGSSFELPVVNIGDRQRGRVRAQNVIDVPECKKQPIIDAIDKAIKDDFRNLLKKMKNPYGEGGSSEKIVNKLKSITLDGNLIKKRFYDAK